MLTKSFRYWLLWFVLVLLFIPLTALAQHRGIYVTQWNFENTTFLNYLIKHAKASGINTFIVDFQRPSQKYQQNISLLKQNNIYLVARIVMFPDGAPPYAINDPSFWQRRYELVHTAVSMGANQIQLDYIRYTSKQIASKDNAKNVHRIIQWYKNKLAAHNVPLQIDVFGIAAFGESSHIGQNIQLFSQAVDTICPMVYPSHYEPFPYHFKHPYETVYGSLKSIQQQFNNKMPVKLIPYIELSNYHYPMSHDKTLVYIKEQLKAVKEAGADGWYAWSPHNRYDNLFYILEHQNSVD